MEYFDNDSHILVLYIEGEGELYDDELNISYFETSLARDYKAALYALEHRFYGESQPFDSLSTENLQFLTTEQALADIATFLNSTLHIARFAPPNDIRKIVVVGGSYAGILSSLFRAFYPQFASISLASSAPVLAQADFYQYDQAVQKGLGEDCTNALRQANQDIEDRMDNGTLSYQEVMSNFGCNPPDTDFDPMDPLYLYAYIPSTLVQYNRPTISVDLFCSVMLNASIGTPSERFYTYVRDVFLPDVYGMTCDEYVYEDEDWLLDLNTSNGGRAWLYQTCTEYGYFQTAPKVNPLRSSKIDLQLHLDECAVAFDNTTVLDTDRTNARFGGLYSFATHVVFTNGNVDPWSTLGITNTSAYTRDEPRRLSWDVSVVLNGSHCSDLFTSDEHSSASVNATHDLIKARLAEYLGNVDRDRLEEEEQGEGGNGSRSSSSSSGWRAARVVVPVVLVVVGVAAIIVSIILLLFLYRNYWRPKDAVYY